MNNKAPTQKSNDKRNSSFQELKNEAIEDLTSNLQGNPDLINIKMQTVHNSSVPKEAEMEALLSEINLLKSKSAMRRCDENKKTSEEIVQLYMENCKLSATIEALNRSLDKRRIQNVSLKEENERHKWEKKRLHTLLKNQASVDGYSRPNKIAIVEKITRLETENVELLNRYNEVVKSMQVERENYAKFLRFIFLKILSLKCFAFSKNKMLENDFEKLEINNRTNDRTNNLQAEPKDRFVVSLSKNLLEEKSYQKPVPGNKTEFDTPDMSLLCKLGALNNESQAEIKGSVVKPLRNKFCNGNRKVNPHLNAVSSGDHNSSSNLKRVNLLIRLYQEKFHDEVKEKTHSKVKTPPLELDKDNRHLKVSSGPVSKPRDNTFSFLRRKSRHDSFIEHVVRIRGDKNIISRKNKNSPNTKIVEIDNSGLVLDSKLELAEKSLVSLKEDKRNFERENEENCLGLFTAGRDNFWNIINFGIKLGDLFSINFQNPLIMNNLGNKFWEFGSDSNFGENYFDVKKDIFQIDNCGEKTFLDLKEEARVEEEIYKIEEITKTLEDTKTIEDCKTQCENPKREPFIQSKTLVNRSRSAYPIPLLASIQKSKQPRLIKNRNKVPKVEKLNPKIEEIDLKIKEERCYVSEPDLKNERQNTKKARDVAKKSEELNKTLGQNRKTRSLSADRSPFLSIFTRVEKARGKEEKFVDVKLNPKINELNNINEKLKILVEELNCEIKERDTQMKEINPKFSEEDIRIKDNLKIKENFQILEKDVLDQESDFKIQVQDIKIEKLQSESDSKNEDNRIQKQDLKVGDVDVEIENDIPKHLEDTMQNTKVEKEIEEKLLTQISSFQGVEEKNIIKKNENPQIENLNPNKSKKSMKEIIIEKGTEKKLKASSTEKTKGKSLSTVEREISPIMRKALKEGNLVEAKRNKKNENSEKNLEIRKKTSHAEVTLSYEKEIKKEKKSSLKRIENSEAKLEKSKITKLESSSMSLHRKVSNSLHKKTLSKTSSNFPTLEVKERLKTEGKSKPKEKLKSGVKQDKNKTRSKLISIGVGASPSLSGLQVKKMSKKLIDDFTETDPPVDCLDLDRCAFRGKSDTKEDFNEKGRMHSKGNFHSIERVEVTSKSISVQSIGNEWTCLLPAYNLLSVSKKPDITSVSPTTISNIRQSFKENHSKNKNGSRNKKRSKGSGRMANKVKMYEGGSNIDSSLKVNSDNLKTENSPLNCKMVNMGENSDNLKTKNSPLNCKMVNMGENSDNLKTKNSPLNCKMVNMGEKHQISLKSDAIEGSEFKVTSLTRNDSDAPIIMIGGDPIIKKEKIQMGEKVGCSNNHISLFHLSKIEAWNVRVRDYLKQVRLKLLEEEKALEEERQRLRQGNHSLGDWKELTPRNREDVRHPMTENDSAWMIKMDLQKISRDVERVKNIINNHTAARYLNRRNFSRVDEKLKGETGSVTKLSCRSSGVTAILNDIGEYWNTFDLNMHAPEAKAKIITTSKETSSYKGESYWSKEIFR